MEWNVKKANLSTERFQLNKILQDIRSAIDDIVVPPPAAPAVVALSSTAGSVVVNCSLAKDFTLLLTENVTLSFTGVASPGTVTEVEIQFTQDGTGSRTVTLPASFKALGGSDTAVASAANAVTVLSAKTFDGGVNWRYAMQESA